MDEAYFVRRKALHEEVGIRLPETGDKLFCVAECDHGSEVRSLDGGHLVSLDGASGFSLIEGYRLAGDLLVDRAARDMATFRYARPQDYVALPVVYLYRHYLELAMKALYEWGSAFYGEPINQEVMRKHSLQQLWNRLRPIIERSDPTPAADLDATEKLICELHAFDCDGQSARYATRSSDERPTFSGPMQFSLCHLKDAMSKICTLLEGVEAAIQAKVDDRTAGSRTFDDESD